MIERSRSIDNGCGIVEANDKVGDDQKIF